MDSAKVRSLVGQWVQLLADRCGSCWARTFCKACFAAAWDGVALDSGVLDAHCERFRAGLERWLEVYVARSALHLAEARRDTRRT